MKTATHGLTRVEYIYGKALQFPLALPLSLRSPNLIFPPRMLKLAVARTLYCDMHVHVRALAPTILPLTVCIRSRHARHAGVPSIKDQLGI